MILTSTFVSGSCSLNTLYQHLKENSLHIFGTNSECLFIIFKPEDYIDTYTWWSNSNVATTSNVDCQKKNIIVQNFIFGRLQYPRNNTKRSTLRFLAFVGFYILCGIFGGNNFKLYALQTRSKKSIHKSNTATTLIHLICLHQDKVKKGVFCIGKY